MFRSEIKTTGLKTYICYITIITLCSLLVVSTFLYFQGSHSYKPVIIVHGILSEYSSMDYLANRIKEQHPGTIVHITNDFGGLFSLEPMWHQVHRVGAEIMMMSAMHPDGIILLGYSQGGLVARAALEAYKDHNVKTFISLSSPQAGQYGTKFLHIFYPDLALKSAYELFYSRIGQLSSVGNYWNDPHHQKLYFNYSKFLPYINNEKQTKLQNDFKLGIAKLDKMVLIGGPDDGVISPWQSR
uniref:palmitoyl-CoA hydrolase n=1 Tax=Clastoptera arizonana TaxID=38151 RepID=A0A1B6DQR5_9HEMI